MEEEVRRADFTFVHAEFEILAKETRAESQRGVGGGSQLRDSGVRAEWKQTTSPHGGHASGFVCRRTSGACMEPGGRVGGRRVG